MESNPATKTPNRIGRAVLFAVLFLLPLGSVYYLYTGRAHHRETVAELEKLGLVSNFILKDQSNADISAEGLRGKVTVVNFLPGDLAVARPLAARIAKVHQSFDETDDVHFLSFIVADSTSSLREMADRLAIADPAQWHLLGATEAEWQRLSQQAYLLPDAMNTVAMVDTSLTIRKLYNINDNSQMGRMVEHIAKVIPKQKRR